MKAFALVGVMTLMAASVAGAQPKYGMAGCGLGSILIKKNTMVMQIVAATLNGTSGNQSLGMTTGTSNCMGSADAAQLMHQQDFIASNLRSLSQDVSRGEGDTLFAYAEVLGCQGVYPQFSKIAQSSYQRIFGAPGALAVLEETKRVLREDVQLTNQCTKLI